MLDYVERHAKADFAVLREMLRPHPDQEFGARRSARESEWNLDILELHQPRNKTAASRPCGDGGQEVHLGATR